MLVAPVLTQGATEREITFPDGQWVDMANPSEVYQGGQTISYAAPLEVLPMFARAGALIARASYPMKNVGDYRTDNYTVRYYPVEGKSDGYIFEDDMSTPTTIAEGRYTLLRFEADATDKTVSVRLAAENGSQDYTNPTVVKNITFEVFNIGSRPASVTFNGKKAAFAYNAASRTVTVKVKWNITTVADLVITK